MLPWRDLTKAALAAASAAVGVALARAVSSPSTLPEGLPWRLIPLFGDGALFGVGYLAILWLTGVRPAAVLGAFWRRRTA